MNTKLLKCKWTALRISIKPKITFWVGKILDGKVFTNYCQFDRLDCDKYVDLNICNQNALNVQWKQDNWHIQEKEKILQKNKWQVVSKGKSWKQKIGDKSMQMVEKVILKKCLIYLPIRTYRTEIIWWVQVWWKVYWTNFEMAVN